MPYVYRPRSSMTVSITFKRRQWSTDATTGKRLTAAPLTLGTVSCSFEIMDAVSLQEWGGTADQMGGIACVPSSAGLTLLPATDFAELTFQGVARELDVAMVDPYEPHDEVHLVEQYRSRVSAAVAGR